MKAPAPAMTTPAVEDDIRPMVGRPVSDRGIWIFGGVITIFAILLFSALEARRSAANSPSILTPREASGNMISGPPPFALSRPSGVDDSLGPVLLTRIPVGVDGRPYTLPGVPNTPRVMQSGYVPEIGRAHV